MQNVYGPTVTARMANSLIRERPPRESKEYPFQHMFSPPKNGLLSGLSLQLPNTSLNTSRNMVDKLELFEQERFLPKLRKS